MAHTAYRVCVARVEPGRRAHAAVNDPGKDEGLRAAARRPSEDSPPRSVTAGGRSVLRYQDDLDAPILGAALGCRVVGHRPELAEGGGGQDGRLDALFLEIARDV